MKIIDKIFPEHFSQADKGAVIASIFASVAFVTALMVVKPPATNGLNQPIAKVINFNNQVKHKNNGSVSFYEIINNELIQNEDEIFTGENSEAVVGFLNSKTKINIPSNSLIKIEQTDQGQTVEIKDGVVDIIIAKDENVNLKVNGVTNTITSTEAEGRVKAYVSMGKLNVLPQVQGIKIKNEKKEVKPLEMNKEVSIKDGLIRKANIFNIVSPRSGEEIDSYDGIKVKTDIKGRYKLSLSKNMSFTDTVKQISFDGDGINLSQTLDDGDYYLKLENADENKIVQIKVASKYKLDGIRPADKEQVEIEPGQPLNLSWNKMDVDSYKIIIKDSLGNERSINADTNEISIPAIKGPQIEWTIIPNIENKKVNIRKTQLVNIKYKGQLNILKPNNGEKFKVATDKVTVNWNPIKGEETKIRILNSLSGEEFFAKNTKENKFEFKPNKAGTYEIEVSSLDYPGKTSGKIDITVTGSMADWDPTLLKEFRSEEDDFRVDLKYTANTKEFNQPMVILKYKPINGKESSKTILIADSKTLKVKGFGDYCLTLTNKTSIPFFETSKDYCFKAIQQPIFEPIKKADDQVMAYSKFNGVDSYKITTPVVPRAVKYIIEVYKDQAMTNLVYTFNTKTPEVHWASNRSGVYYMRYKVIDAKERKSEYSPPSKLIFPISPLSEW